MRLISKTLAIIAIIAIPNISNQSFANMPDDIASFWEESARTVREGDFAGYSNTYHPDAILVSGISNNSYPISQALSGWKQGFDDTASGKIKANVEFRFSSSLLGETTAHQTGMFYYSTTNAEGEETGGYFHFEALLVKKKGWKMMMEYQKSVGSIEDWNKLGN